MGNPYILAEHNITKQPNLADFLMHTHETYEIYCFLSGNAKYFVEGTVYRLKPNDILIIKRAEAHSLLITGDAPYERMLVNFNADALYGANEEVMRFLDDRPLGQFNYYPASRFVEQNWNYYLNQICQTSDQNSKRLYLSILVEELRRAAFLLETQEDTHDIVADVIAYINRHLSDKLSLEQLCEKFYISKSHLNRKFKRLAGSTVWEYVTAKRLVLAKQLLQSGAHPTVVASQCGFREYSAFYYAYKRKFGVSPKTDVVNPRSLYRAANTTKSYR